MKNIFSQKQFAYLHARKHGLTPLQAMQAIRAAIKTSVICDCLFELAFNVTCDVLGIPDLFLITRNAFGEPHQSA